MTTETGRKKKKISLNTIGLVLLAVILGVYFYTWQAGTSTQSQVFETSQNVTIAQLQTKMYDSSAVGLNDQLAAAQTKLAVAEVGFPVTVDRNEVIAYILNVARDYDIQILPLVSDGWVTQKIGIDYVVLQISANGEGTFKNVNAFMDGLQKGRYPTLVIPEFSIIRSDVAQPGFPGEDMKVVVSMKILIYTVPQKAEDTIL
jgi:hypothetical protein